MTNTIRESAAPIKSRTSASTEFARDVFAWFKQIHTDRATIPNAKPMSALDFRLAYAITQYINKFSRKAWPFQETLAEELGVDVRTVGRGIANLVKRGHLSVTRRGRDESAIYQMIIQDQTFVSGHDEVRPDTDVGSKPQDRTSVSVRPDICVPKTRHPCPREPLFEPLREPLVGGAPQARPGTDSLGKSSIGGPESLKSPLGTIDDDDSGVAWRAPPPDHLYIDQSGNPVPPPPDRRRPPPRGKSNVERGREMLRGCAQ
jgi:hypothetical protein